MKYCSHCGNEVVDEAVVCQKMWMPGVLERDF